MIRLIKQLIQSLLHRSGNRWTGNYPSWQAALTASKGYDAPEILEKIKTAALRVKNGEFACERDSVLFEEKQYDWTLIAYLFKAAYENDGHLTVLDFGGSLGSSYYTVRDLLGSLKSLKWCIVEQENYVACGKEYFQDDHLFFYEDIETCLSEQEPQVLLFSSVLQYIERPFELLERVNDMQDIHYLVVLRTSVSSQSENRICVQRVDPAIYPASYPSWVFSEQKLLNQLKHWKLESSGLSPLHAPGYLSGDKFFWKDFVFQRNAHP